MQDFDDDTSKKRKWPEELQQSREFLDKPSKARNMKSIFDTELPETPLPLEWQRCLDIKSGQIYYFNTRTNTKTSIDPRISPDPPSPKHMSLDLGLNLPCGPSSVGNNHHHVADNFTKNTNNYGTALNNHGGGGGGSGGLRRSPSWLACDQGDQQEMVTAVCKKCHMLVMMFKSSPACPNCKFMHPPDQTPTSLFNNRGLSLLC